jgi:hypothetical protein
MLSCLLIVIVYVQIVRQGSSEIFILIKQYCIVFFSSILTLCKEGSDVESKNVQVFIKKIHVHKVTEEVTSLL